MTENWIVGIDGSESADSALAWASVLASECGGHVVPVGAWHMPIALLVTALKRSEADRLGLRATAAADVDAAIERVGLDPALLADPVIVEGHPGPQLLGLARPGSALVLGRRGRSAIEHRLLGSVSQHVATHSSVPVIVVPEDARPPACGDVVVGFDGSPHSIRALEWAIGALPKSTNIRVVMAVQIVPWLPHALVQERFEEEADVERQRLMSAADVADPAGRAQRELRFVDARQALTEAMSEADMIVVGSRGHGAIGSAMLGSVSTWLLHGAGCPVVVVPA